MRKFLSIVIPRYKESEQDVFPLLSSISNQLGVDKSDIEVIVANDGGGAGELNQDFLQLFKPLEIRQTTLKENRGPGVARQAGIDVAQGEYILCCDADDTLHNVGALGALLQEADKSAPDIVSSSWLEESLTEGGKYQYITHDVENTWMHGKLLRRQFLIQNNIKFHPDLRVHEDSYLLSIAAALSKSSIHLPVITYVWKHHPNSITRRNNSSYTYDSIPTFIRACTLADEVVEKVRPELMEYRIVQFLLYNYFCYHQPGWLDTTNSENLKNAETALVMYMKPFIHYWDNKKPELFARVYNEEREKSFKGLIESETVDQWYNRLFSSQ